MTTVGVYAIALNEEANVHPWLENVKNADYILVADTGSTDETVMEIELSQTFGSRLANDGSYISCSRPELHDLSIVPWRFDLARNAALALMPKWVDICVALDLDETISPHWKEAILDNWQDGVNNVCPWFVNGDGYECWDSRRIHSRNGWRWHLPVHEQLYPYLIEPQYAYVPDIVVRHPRAIWHPGYLPLCELGLRENPTDPHALFFLGREYVNCERYDEAVTLLSRYLALTGTDGQERKHAKIFHERAMAAREPVR